VFTARYGLSAYIKQTLLVFKGLKFCGLDQHCSTFYVVQVTWTKFGLLTGNV